MSQIAFWTYSGTNSTRPELPQADSDPRAAPFRRMPGYVHKRLPSASRCKFRRLAADRARLSRRVGRRYRRDSNILACATAHCHSASPQRMPQRLVSTNGCRWKDKLTRAPRFSGCRPPVRRLRPCAIRGRVGAGTGAPQRYGPHARRTSRAVRDACPRAVVEADRRQNPGARQTTPLQLTPSQKKPDATRCYK